MTGATSETTGFGPFTGPFGIGAAVVGILFLLVGIVGFVDGYQEMGLFLPGNSPLVEGAVILTFGAGLGVATLFIAAYMEPGFGDDGH